jgi:hypothetical protein
MSLKKYIDNYVEYIDIIYSNMKTYKKKQQSKRLVNKKKAVTFKTKKVNKTKHNKSKSKRKGGSLVLGRKCQTINLLSNNAKVALNNILLALRGGTHSAKYRGNVIAFIQSSNEGSTIYEVGKEKIIQETNNNKTKQAPIGIGNALGNFTGIAWGGKMIRFSWGLDQGLRDQPVGQIIIAYQKAVEYLLSVEGFNKCIINFISPDSKFKENIPSSITLNIEYSKASDNGDITQINDDLKTFVNNVNNIEHITTQNTNEKPNTQVDNCKNNPLIEKKFMRGEYNWKIPISNEKNKLDVNNLIDIQQYLISKAKTKKGFGNLYDDPDIETNYVAVIGRLENTNYVSIGTKLEGEKGYRIFEDYNKAWKCVNPENKV